MTKGPLYRAMANDALLTISVLGSQIAPAANVVVPHRTDDFSWGHFDHSNGTVETYEPKKPRKSKAQRQARRRNRK